MTTDDLIKLNMRLGDLAEIEDVIVIRKGATNGDVIKTLFPFVTRHISHSENNIYIDSPIQATVLAFDRYWWKAPYKAESEASDADSN